MSTTSVKRLPSHSTVGPRLQDQLCFALYSAAHAFSRRYKPLLDKLGLTYPQYLCMMVLWEKDDVTVTAIGTLLHLDSGTLTPLLKRLEAAGLVRRVRDHVDERQVKIVLTEAGQAMRGDAVAVSDVVFCSTGRSMEDVSRMKDDVLALRDNLNKILSARATDDA